MLVAGTFCGIIGLESSTVPDATPRFMSFRFLVGVSSTGSGSTKDALGAFSNCCACSSDDLIRLVPLVSGIESLDANFAPDIMINKFQEFGERKFTLTINEMDYLRTRF